MKKLTKKEHDKLRDDKITELKGKGYEIAIDKKRNIAIAYNEFLLLFNKETFFNPKSIAQIRQPYLEGSKSTIEYEQNITHEEALKRIDLLENNIRATIDKIKDSSLFDYLPLTKQSKFNKASNINVYRPNIKFTNNSDYFSQNEIVLQIVPYIVCLGDSFTYDNTYIFDDLAILEINKATLSNVLTPPIIDDKGVFNKREWVKNSYIKMDDLVPGCIYKDAKGKLNLYIGEIKNEYEDTKTANSYSNLLNPYLTLTPKWIKILDSCSTMDELIYKVIEDAQKKDTIDWFETFKLPNKIKFTELESIRFRDKDALIKIEKYPYRNYEISIKSL